MQRSTEYLESKKERMLLGFLPSSTQDPKVLEYVSLEHVKIYGKMLKVETRINNCEHWETEYIKQLESELENLMKS